MIDKRIRALIGEYEKNILGGDSNLPESIKNKLCPAILKDIKEIEEELTLKLVYEDEKINNLVLENFSNSWERYLASIKEEKLEDNIYETITNPDRDKYLIDACHTDANNNRLTNGIDQLLYENNKNNISYKEKRMDVKKILSDKVSNTARDYATSIQTNLFEQTEANLETKKGLEKGNSLVKTIPGMSSKTEEELPNNFDDNQENTYNKYI